MRSINKLTGLLLVFGLLFATTGLCWGADATVVAGPPDGKQPPPPPLTADQMKEYFGKRLDQLVNDKVITDKQKATTLEYYGKLFTKIAGQDPRKMMEAFDQLKKSRRDPADLLVKDGILTKEQAAAVGKLFPPQPPKPQGEPGNGPDGNQPPPPPNAANRERGEGQPQFCDNFEAEPIPFGNRFSPQPPCFMAMENGQRGGGRLMPPPIPEMGMIEQVKDRLKVLSIAKVITEQQMELILKLYRNSLGKGPRRGADFESQICGEVPKPRESQKLTNPKGSQTEKEAAGTPDPYALPGRQEKRKSAVSQETGELLAQLVRDGVIKEDQADIVVQVLALPPSSRP